MVENRLIHMTSTTFNLNGITCDGCVSTLHNLFSSMEGVYEVDINRENGEVEIIAANEVSNSSIENVLNGYPKYSIQQTTKGTEEVNGSSIESFKPLIIIVSFILLLVAMSQVTQGYFDWRESMRLFMGGFFIAFSFFKFLDLKGFAQAYSSYDIVSQKWVGWAYLYPFIELSLGLMFLFNLFPFYANLCTLVVLSVSSVGVIRSVRSNQKIKCACLGTGFNLPMTTVTIIEDLSMVVMSTIMLSSM